MFIKSIVFVILVFCNIISCAQENIKLIPIAEKNQQITYENVVPEMLKHVKHYDKEPQYFIRMTQTNCIFELLVNDFPIYYEYTLEKLATPLNINSDILQSGVQTITFRMYPIGDLIKEAYGSGDTVTTLQKNSNIDVKVVRYEAYNINNELEDEIIIKQHESPTNEKGEFKGAGLPYYEYTFTFEADVPYVNEGWTNGEDLTQFDKDDLEQQALKVYKQYQELHKNKDINGIVRTEYNYELRNAIANYRDEQYLKELWEEYKGFLYYKNKEYQPFKDYGMKFYGQNKIISLKYPTINPVDKRLRGKSAFWFLYDSESGLRAEWTYIYLYIPKGGTLADLQTIP